MNTKLMMIGALAAICTAHELAAMPTRAETARAEPAVRRLMASDHAALRARKKTHSEVADAAMKHADETASEAERLLLMKGAFSLYVRAGEYDRAIGTIEKMQAAIPDMPDENVVSIIKSSLRNVSRNEGKVLYAFLDDIKARSRRTDNVRNSAANVKCKFDYRLEDGMAVLTGISPKPVGTLVVPDKIDGHLVTRIEGYPNRSPFGECDRLTKIVLPAGLKFDSFDAGAFISCKSLSGIDIAKSNKDFTSLDGVLYSKDLSTLCVYPKTRDSIKLSPKTKKVGVCAFRGCALKTAKIPEGIEEIERWNLCECPNLESIEFPKSLKRLGACAACGDENLRKIVFYGDAPHADVVHYTSGLTQEVFTGAPENLVVEVRRGSKGWLEPDSIELPELWPTDQKESRPIRYMGGEVMRPMFSSMFPGWQVCPEAGREIGIVSNHRGQDNVAFVHPISPETPAVVSNTLTLSNGNPCLFLKMASFAKDYDFLLSVLVNGKEALPKQLIRTPDSEPWQDITVPLSAWRGEKVKIDVVLAANNWYCEHPFFKRLEVAEGTGQEKLDIEAIGKESGRQAFSRLFPGWETSVEPGTSPSHRGQDDVVFVHPPSPETPAVVSRTLTLSNGNPCLFLKMASFGKDYDFLLSVLVNGKEVLPKRLICTPDSEPWQDITIPLTAWRGQKVKIEIVLAANNWYCEHPFFKRLEVAEGTGQEKLDSKLEHDAKETVNGYTWSYRVNNGEATIVAEKDGKYSCAVSPAPKGDLKIPATLGGVKVTGIGEEAFRFCNDLTSVTVPEGVTHIDTHALAYCRGLQSVTLPSSLRDIGYAAFGKDAELKSVTIPNGVKSIAADAFNGCGLKSVIIPESVMHMGDRAFCACGALEAVAISAGVASIGKGVFGGCNALKLITVDSGNQAFTSIDGVLYTKDRSELVMLTNPPKSVVIPGGVTKIRGWALAVGSGMTSVTIPESVTSIEDHVFLGWDGLKSITIPSSVKNIGERAFEGCRELTEMTMLGERPEAKDLFPGCGKLKAIHVPANAKSWAGMTEWQGIPLVFDADDAGRQTQTENAGPRASLLNRRRLVRERIREEEVRRREAERKAREEEDRRQREAERAEKRRQLEQIREELRKAREEREKAKQAAAQQR